MPAWITFAFLWITTCFLGINLWKLTLSGVSWYAKGSTYTHAGNNRQEEADMKKHYEFVTVEGLNDGCTHAEVSAPYAVSEWEIKNQDFAPGKMEECTRCGASRYVKEEDSMSNGHSYKEEVTREHDAFCIAAALQSALENRADNQDFSFTLEEALEESYGYLAEGLSNCRCRFAAMTGEKRVDYLLQFSDSALEAMQAGGYYNDSTGEYMVISWDDFCTVMDARNERHAHWEAETLANELVGNQDSYSAVISSDTVSQPLYSLQVNGETSKHAEAVTRWGIAYGVARELTAHGVDADSNAAQIAAVLKTLNQPSSVILGDLEFSTFFEANN